MKSEKNESVFQFCKKPFRLGNLLFFIPFRYTFLGFFAIPSTNSTKRYNFCFKCMHNFDCARNAKKRAIDSGANPCSCLDVFLRILRKSVFISQGNSHAKMRKLALSWNPTGIFFTKRYLFCFKSMLRLPNDKKVGNRNPFSFNLTSVKSLRGENTKFNLKMITFPERDFKKSAQKSRNLHFGTLEHLPNFAFSRVRIL